MTPSTNPLPWSAFEEANRAFAAPVQARLVQMCAEDEMQARFLNMLSLLEHIGGRKIMTCPAMARSDRPMLQHLAEETRHALFFKRAAERLAGRPLDYGEGDVLAGAGARLYMGRLDAEITQALGRCAPLLPYLYMSLIVELRAVWTYRLYQEVLVAKSSAFTLKGILGEEELHLDAMLAKVVEIDGEALSRVAQFSGFEQARFRSLWSGIEGDCAGLGLAAE